MSAARVANEAAHPIPALVEVKGRMGVAVRVIFWPPALSVPVMDLQAERTAHFQD
jgi:hypothetical protein